MQVKICGLSRTEDIAAVNTARPDYCGFVIHVPKSRRNVDVVTLHTLRTLLAPDITPVGVFVDEPVEQVATLLNEGVLAVAQLHGHEDENYLAVLRRLTCKSIWQAFQIRSEDDVRRAMESSADFILLDAGGGSGVAFDWTLLAGVTRPFALAGGLHAENIPKAMLSKACLLDVSSGVETNGKKDRQKIYQIVQMIKGERICPKENLAFTAGSICPKP